MENRKYVFITNIHLCWFAENIVTNDMSMNSFSFIKVAIQFHNNHAVLGAALYMSRLDMQACSSVYSYALPFISNDDDISLLNWPIWDFG